MAAGVKDRGYEPTPSAPLGPFYRRNAPFRSRIARPNEPGAPLIVSGRVLGAPACSPIPEAVLDVWQTNRRGLYSRILGFGEFFLRGRLRTSQEGTYRLETIIPGRYPLGRFARPRHIHFMISAPGWKDLTTQIFFEGDPDLQTDPYVRAPLVRPLLVDPSGVSTVLFDFVLKSLTYSFSSR